jgi:2-dehydro-3-deoxygluconokinase
VVTHTERGHVFSYLRAGSAASKIAPINLNTGLIRGARFFHVSAISQAISVNACDTVFTAIDMARDGGAAICYDPNLRLQLWPLRRAQAIIQETIGLSDYFLPSLDDARALTGLTDTDAILDRFFAEGAKTVLLKLGADGVIVADGTQRTHVPGFNVKAVDATGAGDCFAGTFVARLAAGDEVVTAARYANAAAALATTGYGAIEPIPTAEQVAALLHATPHASHA